MKKIIYFILLGLMMLTSIPSVLAKDIQVNGTISNQSYQKIADSVIDDPIVTVEPKNIGQNKISVRSIGAGLLSLIIWPGIGQAVNSNTGDKIVTHAVLGLIPPFRFWSGYDALVSRQSGYWKGRI